MKAFGAELIEHGQDFNEALDFARAQAEQQQLEFFPSFDPDLVAGVATYTAELLTAVPDLEVLSGEGVRTFKLAGDDRRRVSYFAAGARGRIPLLTGIVAARSTQLVNLSRITRFRYLSEFRTDEGGGAWPVYDSVDEGVVVEARPVVLGEESVRVLLGVRVARILARETESPSPPLQAVSATRIRATLAPDEGLLVAGLPAPTPLRERRDRLVVLVTAEVGMPK